MPKFYFTKKKAQEHRKKGQVVVKRNLKNGKSVFKVKNRKK